MNRRAVAAALTAALAACGSDDKSDSGSPASGTILGAPFTPVEQRALVIAPAPCDLTTVNPLLGTRSVAALAVGFSSFANVCGFVSTTGLCGDVASSVVVTAIIANAPSSGTATPIAPGTYAIGQSLDAQFNLRIADVGITKVDAICTDVVPGNLTSSGSITIASVSPRVSGSLDVTFPDGGRFAGTFDAEVCNAAADFCAAATDTCSSTPCCTAPTTCP